MIMKKILFSLPFAICILHALMIGQKSFDETGGTTTIGD